MKDFKGEFIREVWDFRLSAAVPTLYNTGETWTVAIYSKNNPDHDPAKPEILAEPLEVHDTGISTEGGDVNDRKAIAKCYEWLYSVRDKYSLDHIELRKPLVKTINEANSMACHLNAEAETAKAIDNLDLYHKLKGKLQEHLTVSNAAIKKMTAAFHEQVAQGGAS